MKLRNLILLIIPLLLFAEAGTYNFEIEQGETWTRTVVWTDANDAAIDLDGYSIRMHIREYKEDTQTIQILESGAGGDIAITDSTGGTFTLTIVADSTAAMDFTRGYYDLEMVDSTGVVTRLLQGTVVLDKEVTR